MTEMYVPVHGSVPEICFRREPISKVLKILEGISVSTFLKEIALRSV